MGHYTKDPAEIARMNDGLPPDEHVGIVYVMDERERVKWERDSARAEADRRYREVVQDRHRWLAQYR